jgi:signal transduction histidine kinase
MNELRNSGIKLLGEIPWGTHFCSFYHDKEDLLDTLVPYFAAGLTNNEYCLWIISAPLAVADAADALRKTVPDLESYLRDGRIEIVSYAEWYLQDGKFVPENVISAWLQKLEYAIGRGYSGMRVNGNEGWLDRHVWKDFIDYEKELDHRLAGCPIIVLCTYPLAKCDAETLLDVAHVHEYAIAKREGEWQMLEVPEVKLTKAQVRKQNENLEELVAERTSRLKSILENTDTAYILLNPSLRILLMNQLAIDYVTEVLMLHAREGEYFNDGIGKKEKEIFVQQAALALKGSPVSYVSVYPGVNGNARHFSVKLFPISNEHSGISGLVFAASEITQKILLEQQLAAAREQEQLAVTDAMISGEEKARQEMGRELHDNINQVLATVQLYIAFFLKKSTGPEPIIRDTEQLIGLAIKEIRDLSHATISPFIEDESLSEALDNLAKLTERSGAVRVTCKFDGFGEHTLPEKLKLTIYRIVQEQFQNILKYAKAKNVLLKINREGNIITLVIEDDGIGFDTSKKANGIGLKNIRTRISLFNGQLTVISSPGNGCCLTVNMEAPAGSSGF